MYPFERFTARAKKVLTLAQQEAEKAGRSYIGTEHLLLGLLRVEGGAAAKVLNRLGVEIDGVRTAIAGNLGRSEGRIQQTIPTSRVKKVIEVAFEEARRMGTTYVGTEHLLLGLLIEGEGFAAHVLDDLGVDLEKVRADIDRLHHEVPSEEAGSEPEKAPGSVEQPAGHVVTSTFIPRPPAGRPGRESPYGPVEIGRAAQRLADQQHTVAGPEHVLLAALDTNPLLGRMLAALGIDEAKLAELRRIATPPESLVELRRTVHDRAIVLGEWHDFPPGAIADFREAAQAYARGRRPSDAEREELRRLRAELDEAERRWRAGAEPGEDEPGPGEAAP
jgi:hypothetical protein